MSSGLRATKTGGVPSVGARRAGQGTAGKFFKDEALYNNANEVLTEARSLVKAVRENPKKYLSIKLHII